MKISVITPSYQMLDWLKCCVASVRDQEGVEVEHIIRDGCSTDGTPEWLAGQSGIRYRSELDHGMYDAINRGLREAQGEILAYLNCDEQYLPGTLARVARYFDENPEVDVLFGDFVIIDPEGEFRAYRKVLLPTAYISRVHTLPVGTCATFFRRTVIDKHGLYYDTDYKSIADKVWALELVKAGLKMRLLREYTSVFGTTGSNFAYSEVSLKEMAAYNKAIPWILRLGRHFAKVLFRLKKLRHGSYRQEPFSYSIFTRRNQDQRQIFQVDAPRFRQAEFR